MNFVRLPTKSIACEWIWHDYGPIVGEGWQIQIKEVGKPK
jgi:hypothetical protein